MDATAVVASMGNNRRSFFARLRDGIPITGHQVIALNGVGAIEFDPRQGKWVPKPDVLQAFNARHGVVGE